MDGDDSAHFDNVTDVLHLYLADLSDRRFFLRCFRFRVDIDVTPKIQENMNISQML